MRSRGEFDWIVLLVALVLCGIGLAMIFSVGHTVSADGSPVRPVYFVRQGAFLGLGLVALVLGAAVPFRAWESLAWVVYASAIALLLVVLAMPHHGGTQRWIGVGGVHVQPSELAKIGVIFAWARVLAGHRADPNRPRVLTQVAVTLAVPFLLVLRQPDLGTALVFPALALPMLFWRGFRGVHILFLLSPGVSALLVLYGDVLENPWPFGVFIVAVLGVAWARRARLRESLALVVANVGVGLAVPAVWADLKPYQQKRILNFLDPDADRLGAGWQVIQSKIAIGSGGGLGKGYLHGTQKALEFLPAKHTDFIFSALGEELGFLGAMAVILLFGVIVFRALSTAQRSKSQFASTMCVGIAAYFFFQAAINVAMTVGMAPVTGIPLPLVSYGGSSLVVSLFLVGLLAGARRRWYEY